MTSQTPPSDHAALTHEIAHAFVLELAQLGLLDRTVRLETVVLAGDDLEFVRTFVSTGWPRAFEDLIRHEVRWAADRPGTEGLSLTAFDRHRTALLTWTYSATADHGFERQDDEDAFSETPSTSL